MRTKTVFPQELGELEGGGKGGIYIEAAERSVERARQFDCV